jgi:DNA-binding beta-propeller fold protein YncE
VLAAAERQLEDEPFVVIGVHSPKFPNERDPAMVAEAVRRYGITHPVIVDSGMGIWSQYAVRAWPTLVLVSPDGYVAGMAAGEPDADRLVAVIRQVLAEADPATLGGPPLPLRPEPAPPGSLAYPGKVAVSGARLLVADTGHHQVVVADAGGTEHLRVGSGLPGFADGPREAARFHHPNGIAADGDRLFVADTGNHALRAVDLGTGDVTTLTGTGAMGRGPATLRSPWDLAWDGRRLYIAMAGSHQIWVLDPETGMLRVFAGAGPEAARDGPAARACFAQPSGLALGAFGAGGAGGTLSDERLFVADSEASSIREISRLREDPFVRTVAGSGDLFGFGDRDGPGRAALFQHPMGVAAGGGRVFVADTFNHKVKVFDPSSGTVSTLFGDGTAERLPEVVPGRPLRPASPTTPAFFEPEGLAWRDGELIVADTNNHRILAVALEGGSRRVLMGG